MFNPKTGITEKICFYINKFAQKMTLNTTNSDSNGILVKNVPIVDETILKKPLSGNIFVCFEEVFGAGNVILLIFTLIV